MSRAAQHSESPYDDGTPYLVVVTHPEMGKQLEHEITKSIKSA
jgi:hypothetical protein